VIRRVRTGFLLLGLVLLVLLGLLLTRAVESLEREREVRHQAVASRVFDEAERALSEFLREEEARPTDHYFGVTQGEASSPLARAPAQEFVVGYFQIDKQGAISTPRGNESDPLMLRLRSVVARAPAAKDKQARRADLDLASLKKQAAEADQIPGTTRTVQKLDLLTGRGEPEAEDALADLKEERKSSEESPSSYRVLEQLNRAAKSRQQQRSAAIPEDLREPATVAEAEMADEGTFGFAYSPPAEASRPRSPASMFSSGALAQDSPPEPGRLLARMGPSPMAGALLDSGSMILYRTAVVPDEGPYQQAILLDLARFTSWVEARVLGEGGLLEFIEIEIKSADGSRADAPGFGAPPADRFVYQHRFGEPFEALIARVSLAPLPDEGGARYVYAIGLLLIVASTLGLWAVYRRVATAVHFAERRSNFAAAVSHELKTPLTAIRMYAEMLRDGMVGEEAKRHEYYVTITSESERLTRLINNVLEFSRLETQTSAPALVADSLEQPLREVVQLLEPHARSQGFALTFEAEQGLPLVAYDRDALQQLLFNLIDNALKYAREAQRREILVCCLAVDGGVAIRVRDYGPGVAREHEPHLFEAFYRGEDELTRRTKGTGIGLALVQGLAERMGARVAARNHPDGGFEVEIRITADV
jgi:signal transduction histidine kinase